MGKPKQHMRNALKRKALRRYNEAVGGLGLPSKMPGVAYGISAKRCKTGGKLQDVPGSVCHKCYALRNNYTYPSVMQAHQNRWEALGNLEEWTENMVHLLQGLGTMLHVSERYFRFHDSGDIQSAEHLDAIVSVAERNPEWAFWLPTKEWGIVRKYREHRDFPGNLTVRLSTLRTGMGPVGNDLPSSTVAWDDAEHQCPARNQENKCGSCRACWDRDVANVNYPLH